MSLRQGDFRRWMRMSALRLAALYAAGFVLILILVGALASRLIWREIDETVDALLLSDHAVAAERIRAGTGPDSQINLTRFTVVAWELAPTPGPVWYPPDLFSRSGFFYDDIGLAPGEQPEGPLELFTDSGWEFYGAPVGQGMLIVGRDLEPFTEAAEEAREALFLAGVLAVVLAIVMGGILGLRAQRRLNRVDRTLREVAAGNLGARIAAGRSRDDLDDLSGRVDGALDQLEQLMQQTRQLSANIAHDLRTPLTRLRVQLDQMEAMGDGTQTDTLQTAQGEVDKLLVIFDGLLRIARLEVRGDHGARTLVDLGTLVTDLAETYAPIAEDSGHVLTWGLDGAESVFADRALLFQLLANLVENALRHTPAGSEVRSEAAATSLRVCDTGPGVPTATLERLTQPLFQVDASRSNGGSGLGLALVQAIADRHGARLTLRNGSDIGPGLCVELHFPSQPPLG